MGSTRIPVSFPFLGLVEAVEHDDDCALRQLVAVARSTDRHRMTVSGHILRTAFLKRRIDPLTPCFEFCVVGDGDVGDQIRGRLGLRAGATSGRRRRRGNTVPGRLQRGRPYPLWRSCHQCAISACASGRGLAGPDAPPLGRAWGPDLFGHTERLARHRDRQRLNGKATSPTP
jgi:hypothetical protein